MTKLKLELSPAPPAGRLQVLDELKGIAIVLVVLYHIGGVLGWRNHLRGDLGVDMFVILSAIGLTLGRTEKGAASFLRRRLFRIFPTYWIVLTLFLGLNTSILLLDYSALNIALHYAGIHAWFGDVYAMSINDSFWFITLVLTYYLFHPWLSQHGTSLARPFLIWAAIAVGASLLFFFTGQSGTFGHFALRLPGFLIGVIIGHMLRSGAISLELGPPLIAAVFLLTYLPYTQGIVFHSVVMGLALMALYVFLIRPLPMMQRAGRTTRVLGFLGNHSLEIFLLHQPLIREYNVYVHGRWFGEPSPGVPSLTFGIAAALALTIFASVELRRLMARIFPR